jgi:protein-L-isoaspartate(D-aspartate) O-methyltransferase
MRVDRLPRWYKLWRTDRRQRLSDFPPGEGSVGRMEFLLHLRRHGIGDAAVLRAMDEVPREHFVTPEFVDAAYADQALPIACGQTISQPYVVAYMTEQLGVLPHHRVLEIGTGSGYQAAVLSRLAREVFSLERFRTLAESARVRLETLGFDNVTVCVGDGLGGLPEHAPFDRIIVTAAAEQVPPALVEQLTERGVLLLPLGPHGGTQRIVKLANAPNGLDRHDLIAVRFVPLLPGQAREL